MKLSIVALLAFCFTTQVADAQLTEAESPCGLLSSISCSNSTHSVSCKFDQISAEGDACLKPVTITTSVCNKFNDFHDVEILNAGTAVELTGNGFVEADRGTYAMTGPSVILSKDECLEKTFENININTCGKRYNVKINADAKTSVNNNCRSFKFKKYSNKRECKISTRAECFVVETGTKCSDTFFSRSTCGVKTIRYELEYCNNNNWPPASMRIIKGRSKITLGRDIDPGHLIDDPKDDLESRGCFSVERFRDVNTCRSYAPHANVLLNARILDDEGKPDTINNQHCFSNTYLAGHSWGLPYPSEAPTTTPTFGPTDTPATSPTDDPTGSPTSSPTDDPTGSPTSSPTKAPIDSSAASPTDDGCSGEGKGSKGCSKGSKGSKGKGSSDVGGRVRRRERVRNRRNL